VGGKKRRGGGPNSSAPVNGGKTVPAEGGGGGRRLCPHSRKTEGEGKGRDLVGRKECQKGEKEGKSLSLRSSERRKKKVHDQERIEGQEGGGKNFLTQKGKRTFFSLSRREGGGKSGSGERGTTLLCSRWKKGKASCLSGKKRRGRILEGGGEGEKGSVSI